MKTYLWIKATADSKNIRATIIGIIIINIWFEL